MRTSATSLAIIALVAPFLAGCFQEDDTGPPLKLAKGKYSVEASAEGRRQFTDVLLLCSGGTGGTFPNESWLKIFQERMKFSFYKPSFTPSEYPCAIGSFEQKGRKVSAQGTCKIPALAETQQFKYSGSVKDRSFNITAERSVEYGAGSGANASIAESRKRQVKQSSKITIVGGRVGDC